MFEELERFPIKAGFSQQASCQICFSIISFNWDPRFCETYTCDLKMKSWLPDRRGRVLSPSGDFWDLFSSSKQADSCHLVSESQTARNVGSVQSFASQATICHLYIGKRGRHFRDHLPSARHFREHLLGIARPRRPLGILHGIRDKGGIREIIGQQLEDNTFTICILRMIRFNIRILLCWQWFSQNIVKIFWEIL